MGNHHRREPIEEDRSKYRVTRNTAETRAAIIKSRRLLIPIHKKQCAGKKCNCGLDKLPKLPRFPRD